MVGNDADQEKHIKKRNYFNFNLNTSQILLFLSKVLSNFYQKFTEKRK